MFGNTGKWGTWFTLVLVQLVIMLGFACRVSEFSCKGNNNICIPLDKYCDGRVDCDDNSDEPKHCSGK